ncbi:MAG: D-2-hydroxyacid dehydrogenase [Ruminococcaceae bacterium]|nr:D-2-hydroxyacid dehydrogenase [Oscillospiraceae bacterium]
MKIIITDASTITSGDLSFDIFGKFGELVVYQLCNEEELKKRIKDADIVLCNKTPMTKEVLKCAEKLKYIGLFATGYNNVDLEYTAKRNIAVCNVPGYSTEAVAQHTFALILEILCKTSKYNETVKQGDWIKSRTFSYFPLPIFELSGKVLGIVGLGSIGKRVAQIAMAFGMKVIAFNRSKISFVGVEQVDFEYLLKNADIVSLHCPLNKDSDTLMNEDAFSKMKDSSILINTARGGLVDEIALRDALGSGKLLGAGLDVLKNEPMNKDCPLFNIDNCIITPHIAWAGLETRKRLLNMVAENLTKFLEGKPINVLNN